jgi:hypothetical protein
MEDSRTRAALPSFTLQFPAEEIEALSDRFGYAENVRLLAAGAAARARGNYTRRSIP